MPDIRAIAICIFRDADRILVAQGYDSTKDEHFLRPLGGALEFGERARDALCREIGEELGAEISEPELLAVMENLFVYAGLPGHEIVFVFDAKFRDPSLYTQAEIPIAEREGRGPATWQSIAALKKSGKPLYPEGLLSLLEDPAERRLDLPPARAGSP
jgi:ADP-ribose pyrophosphatase YjhB (NUDIX family)